ncbi:MAG: methyltransferase domain-containing protein [Actinomycetota bacterium]|nr:methyltransferase domain-containing protein [Actinomycetota bacterium]
MIDNATSDHDEWLAAVYSDRTLATELTGIPAHNGHGVYPQVTSSTTMPSLVMAMLEDLDVADDMRVLEIGTGTGYNAALLCERLGDRNITSIDIGAESVALAAVRLTEHGYRPHLVTGDGAAGVPERAPFDRIIATCGIDTVPAEWISQTRDGGKILANVLGPFNRHALVLLTVHNGIASGPFLAQSGGSCPAAPTPPGHTTTPSRCHRAGKPPTSRPATAASTLGTRSPTPPGGLLAQIHLHDVTGRTIHLDEHNPDENNLGTELATTDGRSWALVAHLPDQHGHLTRQAGPRRLWTELEQLHHTWTAHGRPGYQRFGLTIEAPPLLWLDNPNTGHIRATPGTTR